MINDLSHIKTTQLFEITEHVNYPKLPDSSHVKITYKLILLFLALFVQNALSQAPHLKPFD